jgi:hypothetical protein
VIYCVVPRPLAGELFDRLTEYYKDEPHVEVIVDRRAQGGSPGDHPGFEDRRRKRPKGSFPPIEPPSGG